MAEYRIGDTRVRRKNLYMPCIIGARVEEMTDEEHAQILKATRWADLITNAEWKAVLRHDDCSPSAKSRLKTKASHWLIALGRIALLHPELFAEITPKAAETYEEQIEDDSFVLQTVRNLAETQITGKKRANDGEDVRIASQVWIEDGD